MTRLFLLAALATIIHAPVRACDYSVIVEGDIYEAALHTLPAVFVGRVNRVEVVAPDSLLRDGFLSELQLGFHYRATFAVVHAWTGPTDSVAVDWSSNCEVAFEVGRRYVVFADRWEGGEGHEVGALIAPIWWETAYLEDGYNQIQSLNSAAVRLRGAGLSVEPWKL